MQSDLRFAIVSLYALCALGIIGSFAAFRFAIGDWLVGVVDLLIVGVFLALAILAWRPQCTRLAADLTAASASLAGLGIVIFLDLSYLWTFAILVSNFLMATRWLAVTLSIALIAGLGLQTDVYASPTEHATFMAVAIMVSLFSLIFASQANRQHGQLSEIAVRDALTGALNRRALERDLAALLSHRATVRPHHCLAFIDLDDFKRVNDQMGHDAGDEILARLADCVQNFTREQDRFYRYGGEEFVLLLPHTPLAGAETVVEKLRRALVHRLELPSGRVTASFGLAEHQPGESTDDWLRRADQALLRAKRNGKNRVEAA